MHATWGLLLFAATALTGAEAPESGARAFVLRGQDLIAHRTRVPIEVDGRLDEAAWAEAPVFTRFVESFPSEGRPADLRTEARILFDDEFIYFGVKCFDPDPSAITRQLGRRDSLPASDKVELALDSALDGRTAYHFTVNAAGVLHDELISADVGYDESWDAIWDGSAAPLPDGWSVEFAIPLRTLRFSAAQHQTWGISSARSAHPSRSAARPAVGSCATEPSCARTSSASRAISEPASSGASPFASMSSTPTKIRSSTSMPWATSRAAISTGPPSTCTS